jgi:hypothetical protein
VASARPRLEKTYGNHTGRRFAAVVIGGHRVDVLTRGTKDGTVGNAWGDPYPFEETRRAQIFAKAAEIVNDMRPSHVAPKANPFDGSKRQVMRAVSIPPGTEVTHTATGLRVRVAWESNGPRGLKGPWYWVQFPKEVPGTTQWNGTYHMGTVHGSTLNFAGRTAPKQNPPLVVLGNPGKSRGSHVLSKNIVSIRYKHVADGDYYEHKFKAGSCIELLPDGSIRVFSPRGVKLWGDY